MEKIIVGASLVCSECHRSGDFIAVPYYRALYRPKNNPRLYCKKCAVAIENRMKRLTCVLCDCDIDPDYKLFSPLYNGVFCPTCYMKVIDAQELLNEVKRKSGQL